MRDRLSTAAERLSGFFRRRPAAAAAGLAAVALAGVGAAMLVAGEDRKSRLEKRQLENVAPGSSKRPRNAVPAPPDVRRLVARLPLSRQVAQLFVVDVVGQYPRDRFFVRMRRRDWGGFVVGAPNFVDQAQMIGLTGEIRIVSRIARHLPPLIAVNQSGGSSSAFPNLPPRSQPRIGATGRPGLARQQARAAGAALRRLGLNMNLAPVADVGTPGGPIPGRVFGDDPALVARMARAAVEGYRSRRTISAVGHFPGIGAATDDPDVATASVGLSLQDLRRRDLRPFAAISKRAPVVVMANAVYAAFDGVTPAVLLPDVVGGMLRRDLGFRGVVMTGDMNATAAVVGKTVGAVSVDALNAGADLVYVSGGGPAQERAYRAVMQAARSGVISRERLRLSVLRVLALKRRYGILPRPRAGGRRAAAARRRATARRRAAARRRASARRRAAARRRPPAGRRSLPPASGTVSVSVS